MMFYKKIHKQSIKYLNDCVRSIITIPTKYSNKSHTEICSVSLFAIRDNVSYKTAPCNNISVAVYITTPPRTAYTVTFPFKTYAVITNTNAKHGITLIANIRTNIHVKHMRVFCTLHVP